MKNNTIRSRNPKGQFTTAPHKRVAATPKRKPTRLKEAGPTSNPDGSIVEGPQN